MVSCYKSAPFVDSGRMPCQINAPMRDRIMAVRSRYLPPDAITVRPPNWKSAE